MTDNVVADLGTGGATFATDDIGGIHYPLNKFGFGALDSFTIASSGNGTTDAGTQRVTLASDGAGQVVLAAGSATVGEVTMGAATTAAGDLAKAEDAVHGSGDVGVMSLAVRNDALAALADTDGDYAPLQVDADGALYTKHPNTISTNNSSTSTLTSASTFTGTGDDVSSFASITVQIDASHDSATDGMTFQFSTDNSNWDDVYLFTYTAADAARRFQFPVTAQFFRVVYTNGGTGQTHFRLQTILHANSGLTSIHRLVDNVDPDRSAQLSKSVIIAQAAGAGDFIPVQATAGGNLKMSVEEISDGLDIGAGNAGSETQRVSISTDDVNLSSINTDAGTIAGAVAGTEMQVDVIAALPTGSNLIGDVGLSGARTSGGTTLYKNIDVDESEDQVKGTAGQVYWIHAINTTAAPVFLKFYNVAAASVTVGTTVPDLTFPVPANADSDGAGFTLSIPNGIAFGTAITIAGTGLVADNDATAIGGNALIVNLGFA